MKQISLHVYQSIDGCPTPSDKHFDAAVDASSCVLIDEENLPAYLYEPFGLADYGERDFGCDERRHRPDGE